MRPPLTAAESLGHAQALLDTVRWSLDRWLRDRAPGDVPFETWVRELRAGEDASAWLVRVVGRGMADDPSWPDRVVRAELVLAGFTGRWPRWRGLAESPAWRPVVR